MPTNTLIRATLGTTWSLCGLGCLLVLARVFLIVRRRAVLAWDFFWIIMSTVLSIAFQVLIELAVDLGAGLHLDQIQLTNVLPAVRLFFNMCCLGVATVCTAKLAVVAFLWRMDSPTKSKWWKRSLVLQAVLLVIICVVQIALVEVSRQKVRTLGDLIHHDSIDVLNDSFDFAYAFGAFSALVDLYLTIYPALLVYLVCKSRTAQIAAMFPIMLGVLPIAAAIVRTVALHAITAGYDVTYNAAAVLLCFSVEYGATAVLVSLVPVGAALLDKSLTYPGSRLSFIRRRPKVNDGGEVELLDTRGEEKKATVSESGEPEDL